MPKAAKLGDIGTGHGACSMTPIILGSDSVNIDGQPAARMGDPLFPHAAPDSPPHPRFIVTGSTSVKINGQPAARLGDLISCGGVVIGTGSVNIG
ncbi:type VI secretion system PAAR protein [Vibrio sp. S4M6]|uniref:type VI secretion system PAAR protein n=1 Tax=Vibrio sinus TaxID=2946865 RepID=UPI002029CFBF|nr:type VI secretion system PAAR protein [Vibrio sinus]MCL9783462.1 type VI secretion system PAAR protein [Vibrio sinus]